LLFFSLIEVFNEDGETVSDFDNGDLEVDFFGGVRFDVNSELFGVIVIVVGIGGGKISGGGGCIVGGIKGLLVGDKFFSIDVVGESFFFCLGDINSFSFSFSFNLGEIELELSEDGGCLIISFVWGLTKLLIISFLFEPVTRTLWDAYFLTWSPDVCDRIWEVVFFCDIF